MRERFYTTAFGYKQGAKLLMKGTDAKETLGQSEIMCAFTDTKISRIDLDIMRVLYSLQFANRSLIERCLRHQLVANSFEDTAYDKKTYKRNILHLCKMGILKQFSLFGPEDTDSSTLMNYYCLSREATIFMARMGAESPYDDATPSTVVRMLEIMAYNQFQLAVTKDFGDRFLRSETNYSFSGYAGKSYVDGFFSVEKNGTEITIFSCVIRRSPSWAEDLKHKMADVMLLCEGLPSAAVVIICEDVSHIEEANQVLLTEQYPVPYYYTYDVFVADGTMRDRLITFDEGAANTMQYTSLAI